MREGPLSDLFRSTSEDAPVDPPEAPRYGRQDPAEARKMQDEGAEPAGPVSDSPSSPTGEDGLSSPPAAEADIPLTQGEEAPSFFDQDAEGSGRDIESSSES
ncbi:MAG TPA: hypothetical protein VN732_02225, partial [Solirubrobacterales bacterium]|nr:hypothetical protein [Solirubrobacterales bacterium]